MWLSRPLVEVLCLCQSCWCDVPSWSEIRKRRWVIGVIAIIVFRARVMPEIPVPIGKKDRSKMVSLRCLYPFAAPYLCFFTRKLSQQHWILILCQMIAKEKNWYNETESRFLQSLRMSTFISSDGYHSMRCNILWLCGLVSGQLGLRRVAWGRVDWNFILYRKEDRWRHI